MNKKIRVIDLIDKKYHNLEMPQNIRLSYAGICETYKFDEGIGWYITLDDTTVMEVINKLNMEVEILEDNTEEIEELDTDIHIDSFMDAELSFNKIAQEINKLGKAIEELRKENE